MHPDRFKHMINAGDVVRFHAGKVIKQQTVGQHTFNMLAILDTIYFGDPPAELMRAVLYHDLHEVFTGDVPYPVKRDPRLAEGFAELEEEINQTWLWEGDPRNPVLKAIDMLEFMHYLHRERTLGNTNNQDLWERVKKHVDALADGITDPAVNANFRKLIVRD